MKTYHEKVWTCTIIVTLILFTFSIAQTESIKGMQFGDVAQNENIKGVQFRDGNIIYGRVIKVNSNEIQIETKDGKIISRKVDEVVILINNTGVDAKKGPNTPVESSPSVDMVLLDVLLVRPLCIGGTFISTSFFIVTILPVHIIGAGEQWYNLAVKAPWEFATTRRFGEFTTYNDDKQITFVE